MYLKILSQYLQRNPLFQTLCIWFKHTFRNDLEKEVKVFLILVNCNQYIKVRSYEVTSFNSRTTFPKILLLVWTLQMSTLMVTLRGYRMQEKVKVLANNHILKKLNLKRTFFKSPKNCYAIIYQLVYTHLLIHESKIFLEAINNERSSISEQENYIITIILTTVLRIRPSLKFYLSLVVPISFSELAFLVCLNMN